MMKQKEFISVVTAFAALLILSTQCTRPQKEPLQQSLNQTETSPNPRGSLRAEDVATNLATEQFDTKDFVELANLIAQNVANGYDEKLYFSDLGSEGSLRDSQSPFLNKLRDMSSELRGAEKDETLENSKLSLYWMNSKDWNKQERPTIAYVTDSTPKDAKEIPGIITNERGEVIKKVMVNERYAETHPTIIVNNSPKPDGTPIIAKPKGYKSPLNLKESDLVYNPIKRPFLKSLYLGKMQVTKQYDPWIDGGSEFYVIVAYPVLIPDGNGGYVKEEKTTKQYIEFTRKEINDKTTKELDYILVSSWNSTTDNIGFLLYEDDATWAPGGNFTFEFGYKGFSFKIIVPIPNTRDDITSTYYAANFLQSTSNYDPEKKTWKWHNSDGLRYTLPIVVGYLIPDSFLPEK